MVELWKPVYGYEEFYEVSNFGRVRSKARYVNGNRGTYLKDGRILKQLERRHGYLAVFLYGETGRKQVSVHRLVAEAFCERKDGQNEVNHLDEDKQNNCYTNLEWCNRSENCSYGEKLAKSRELWRNNNRSRAVRQLTLSGEFVREYPSMHEAKRQTGFAEGNIHKAINGVYSHAYGYRWEYV